MGGRKRGLAVIAVIMAVALATSACSGTEESGGGASTGSKEPIKVGVIVSLTGTYAGIGTPEKQTIELEAQKLNDAGGINGAPVEVIFEDDATDPTKAVSAATKLIDQDKVVVILGPSGTGQTMAIRGEIDRSGLPNISMAGGSVILDQFDKLSYTTAWTNKIVVPYTLEYLQKQGLKKIGVISDSGAYGKDGVGLINSEASKFGIEIVANEVFNIGDTDMTAQLTKIKSASPDAVVMWTAGKEAATVLKNAKDLGITAPIYGSHGNARKELVEGAGPAAEGFRFAAGKVLMPETYGADSEQYKLATDFIKRFTDSTGAPPSTFAGHAYDAFNVLVNALKATDGDTDPAKLNAAIEATKDLAGVGGIFNFTATDHGGLSTSDVQMYEVKGGEWTLAP